MDAKAEKVCSSCLVMKPAHEYGIRHLRGKLTIRSQCLSCESAYFRSDEYREQRNIRQRRYRAEGRLKEAARRNAYNRKGRYPEREKARQLVKLALARGDLTRPTRCETCNAPDKPGLDGRTSIQAHHENYGRPLDVKWLCHACHSKEHRALIEVKA